MKKLLYPFLMLFSLLVVLGITYQGVNVLASSDISSKLEQQENSSLGNETKIRYIATIENVSNLNDVTSITFNFYLYKYDSLGSYSNNGTYTTTTVYDEVTGTNGKTKNANTYYAVYTVTKVDSFIDYTLSVYVTINTVSGVIETNEVTHTIQDSGDSFFKGMDSSAVPALENAGVTYKNDLGIEEDVFRVLADHGINYIRVRIWNDPYYTDSNNVKHGYGGGNCDLANAIEIGKRANRYGMKLLVDFHYSDFWADPAKQKLPKAWEGYSDSQIVDAIYDFTYESLTEMKNSGIDVGMVQVGNETNDALCGHMGDSNMSAICSFFNSGSSAVREVYPNSLVALHFANPSNYSTYQWYAAQLNTYNVDYDVFGTSYYPYWHGTHSNLSTLLNEIATTYNKKVCVLETAYANTEEYTDSRSDGYNNTVFTREQELADDVNAYLPYEFTVEGQENALSDLMTLMSNVKNGLGVFYWEGTWIKTPLDYATASETYGTGWGNKYAYYYDSKNYTLENGGCAIENEAFFDENGNPFDSLNVFKMEVNPAYSFDGLVGGTFEDADYPGWTFTNNSGADITIQCPKTDNYSTNKTGMFDFWGEAANSCNFDLSQDISGANGAYVFSIDISGGNGSDVYTSDSVYAYASVNGEVVKSSTIQLSGWDDWHTLSVAFTAKSTDTVIVGISVNLPMAGSWGDIDNAVLSEAEIISTNTLENADFENYTLTWLVDNELGTAQVKDMTGSSNDTRGFNFWDSDALDFNIYQDISGNQGNVSFSIEISGGASSDYEIYAYVSVNGVITKSTTTTTLAGFDNWITISIDGVSILSTDTVLVGVHVSYSGTGGWGWMDNATLSIS